LGAISSMGVYATAGCLGGDNSSEIITKETAENTGEKTSTSTTENSTTQKSGADDQARQIENQIGDLYSEARWATKGFLEISSLGEGSGETVSGVQAKIEQQIESFKTACDNENPEAREIFENIDQTIDEYNQLVAEVSEHYATESYIERYLQESTNHRREIRPKVKDYLEYEDYPKAKTEFATYLKVPEFEVKGSDMGGKAYKPLIYTPGWLDWKGWYNTPKPAKWMTIAGRKFENIDTTRNPDDWRSKVAASDLSGNVYAESNLDDPAYDDTNYILDKNLKAVFEGLPSGDAPQVYVSVLGLNSLYEKEGRHDIALSEHDSDKSAERYLDTLTSELETDGETSITVEGGSSAAFEKVVWETDDGTTMYGFAGVFGRYVIVFSTKKNTLWPDQELEYFFL